jgi:hypothetical protein
MTQHNDMTQICGRRPLHLLSKYRQTLQQRTFCNGLDYDHTRLIGFFGQGPMTHPTIHFQKKTQPPCSFLCRATAPSAAVTFSLQMLRQGPAHGNSRGDALLVDTAAVSNLQGRHQTILTSSCTALLSLEPAPCAAQVTGLVHPTRTSLAAAANTAAVCHPSRKHPSSSGDL